MKWKCRGDVDVNVNYAAQKNPAVPGVQRGDTGKAHPVEHLLYALHIRTHSADGNRLALEGFAARHGFERWVAQFNALYGRPFVVAVRQVFLGLRAGQVFEEFDSVGRVLGVFGDGTASNVQVRTPGALVGENHADLVGQSHIFGLVRAHQAGKVVAVGDGDVAFPGRNGFDLVGVAAFGRACKVVFHPLQPGLRFLLAQVFGDGTKQAQVVGVRA